MNIVDHTTKRIEIEIESNYKYEAIQVLAFHYGFEWPGSNRKEIRTNVYNYLHLGEIETGDKYISISNESIESIQNKGLTIPDADYHFKSDRDFDQILEWLKGEHGPLKFMDHEVTLNFDDYAVHIGCNKYRLTNLYKFRDFLEEMDHYDVSIHDAIDFINEVNKRHSRRAESQ